MAELSTPQEYEVVIRPSRNWLNFDWQGLWEYRDLLVLLVQRDFISRYKQTILGPLWFLLQPVLTAIIFAIVFGGIAGIATDGTPKLLFYLCGLLGWNYFSQNIAAGGATFVNNASLFGKVYFPRLIVPLSIVIANCVILGIQAIPFFGALIFYKIVGGAEGVHLTWMAPLVVLPILQTALLSLGVSLWMSASTAKYRDLVHLMQYLIQIWMFVTPIFWPVSRVPANLQWLLWLNPMAVPTEAFHITLLGHGTLGLTECLISVGVTLFLFLTGVALFQKIERTVVDSV